ncbi:MAG: R3H domain-containing nucleic acid-binding protein [Candidatus Staskawiczbacteria bacterium]|jgi:spoIIIJ-associated protein
MLEQKEINKIKEAAEEFFEKMTIAVSNIEVNFSPVKKDIQDSQDLAGESMDVVNADIRLDEPQILIGQGGQTLFEIQRLLKTILNKKLQKIFYFDLDINDYKKKKVEYLKDLAKDLADQVSLSKETKVLMPMSSYERRIIHSELSKRTDVITESQGDGFDRHVVIKPK